MYVNARTNQQFVIIDSIEFLNTIADLLSSRKLQIFIQQAPLNGITLGQTISDSINRMILLTGCFHTLMYSVQKMGPMKSDPNKRLIPLTVSPLSGAHCTSNIGSLLPTLSHAHFLTFPEIQNFRRKCLPPFLPETSKMRVLHILPSRRCLCSTFRCFSTK